MLHFRSKLLKEHFSAQCFVSLPSLLCTGANRYEIVEYNRRVGISFLPSENVYVFFSFEFATNEVVNVVETVNLETLSSDSGNRDFIAVGTSVHRGEDLAVRGAVCLFYCLLQ